MKLLVGGLCSFALSCINCMQAWQRPPKAAKLLSNKQRPFVSLYSIDLRQTACLQLHGAAMWTWGRMLHNRSCKLTILHERHIVLNSPCWMVPILQEFYTQGSFLSMFQCYVMSSSHAGHFVHTCHATQSKSNTMQPQVVPAPPNCCRKGKKPMAAGLPSDCPLCGILQDMQPEPKHDRQLTIDCVAEITGAWHTQDPHILTALHHHHIWSEAFIDTRLRWRPKQVITALELRCRQLQQPLVVQNDAKYWGCFSWCELERGAGPAQLHDATPALDDRAFQTQQSAIREALQSIECTQVSLTT